MKDILIEKAKMKDLNKVVRLSHGLFMEDGGIRDPYMNVNWPLLHGNEHFKDLIQNRKSICLLAWIDELIVGYIAGYHNDSEICTVRQAVLQSMYVQPEYRSQGIGTKLIQCFIDWASNENVKRIKVTAYVKNEGAARFYNKNKFREWELTLKKDLDN